MGTWGGGDDSTIYVTQEKIWQVNTDSHECAEIPKLVDKTVEVSDVVRDVYLLWINLLQPSLIHFCDTCRKVMLENRPR